MSKFFSNVIKLFSAALIGQILGIIFTPILSRLYSPADFGIFQLFVSMVALIAGISCFSYYSAILLPKKDEDSANLVVLCLILIVFTSSVTAIVFFVFSGDIEHAFNAPGFSNYTFLIPIAIICSSFAYVLNFWLARREEFGTLAKINIYSSISGKSVSVGSGIISPSPYGLIFGTIINDAVLVLGSLKKIIQDFPFFENVSYKKLKQLAYRYQEFPRYGVGSNLAESATITSIPFMLALMFSPMIVGFYSMAYMVVRLPSKVIGNSISSVFFQKVSVEKNLTGEIKNVVKNVHKRLISIGIFAFLILMIIGPELFSFILGAQWYTAGVYAQILAPWFFVTFISLPLISIFNVLEKQRIRMIFNVLLFIFNVSVLYIGGLSGDPIIGMLLLSGTGIFFYTWMNLYSLKIAGVSARDGIAEILRYLLFGLFISIPLIIAKYYSIPYIWLMVVAIIVSIIYYTIIIYQDTQLKEGIINSSKNMFKDF